MIVFAGRILKHAQQTGQIIHHLAAGLGGIAHGDVQIVHLAGQLIMQGVKVGAVVEGKVERLLEIAVQGNLFFKRSQVKNDISHGSLLG